MTEHRWALRDGIDLISTPDGTRGLRHGHRGVAVGPLEPAELSWLRAAAGEPRPAPPGRLSALMPGLHRTGWASRHVFTGDRPSWSSVPQEPPAAPVRRGRPPAGARLSRFAALRRDGDRLTVESPLATHRLILDDPAVAADLLAPAADGPLVTDAWRSGLLAGPGDDEAGGLDIAQWKPFELAFHHASRLRGQRLGAAFGATAWARGRFPELPERRAGFGTGPVPLTEPDPAGSAFAVLHRARRSIREYDESHPIGVDQVAALLHRCTRGYPSGGALFELEFYVLARHVAGLRTGLHHYDRAAHTLERVPARSGTVGSLLTSAGAAMAGPAVPQAVIVVSARFGRLMWKYESIGYALVLKHVGVLMQSFYLSATEQGLAPCALGTGDAATFAEAIGTGEHVESSVGEFALGSRPAPGGAS